MKAKKKTKKALKSRRKALDKLDRMYASAKLTKEERLKCIEEAYKALEECGFM